MSLWVRLRRLWGQSHIRLPKHGLDAAQLRVGDRLQIGGELWRAVDCLPSASAAFALENSALAARRAELRCGGTGWELVEGETAVSLFRAEIQHFPVDDQGSNDQRTDPDRQGG